MRALLADEPAYWYRTDVYICPPCGREDILKSREYTTKPDDPSERTFHHETSCGCVELSGWQG